MVVFPDTPLTVVVIGLFRRFRAYKFRKDERGVGTRNRERCKEGGGLRGARVSAG